MAVTRQDFPTLGCGVGLRTAHYERVLQAPAQVDWFEVIAENFMVDGGRPLRVLERVRVDYPVVLHGVSLSIGSTDPLDRAYLRRLKLLAERVQPAWLSDHLCWTGAGGRNLHDLLPLPYTEEVVAHVAGRVRQVQEILQRPLLLENISSYLTFASSRMEEAQFVRAVAQAAGCAILLDINNIYVNAVNHGLDPRRYIDCIPPELVVQYHLAGHRDCGAYLLDTHDEPIRPAVWELYQYAVGRLGPASTLIEWDDRLPAFEVLEDAAAHARRLALGASSGAGIGQELVAPDGPRPFRS
jgi:uncharacterized protein (UPF0276 family)